MKLQRFFSQTSSLLLAAWMSLPAWAGQYDAELLSLTNAERSKQGVAALCLSSQLNSAAQAHAEDMANNNYFSHTSQDGRAFFQRIAATGYSYSGSAENIAAAGATPSETISQWMNSSGHRTNLLNTAYTEVGFGYAYNANSQWQRYWVQVLAKPAGAATCSNSSGTGTGTETGTGTGTDTQVSRLLNISTRAYISGGQNDAYAGFVIHGDAPLKVLIRGIAVTAGNGVDPQLTLLKLNSGTWQSIASNNEWEAHSSASAIMNLSSALQLPDRNRNDAGMLVDLTAGVYSVQLSSNAGPGLAVIGVDSVE